MSTFDNGTRMIAIKRDNFGWMEGIAIITRKYLPNTEKLLELVLTWHEVTDFIQKKYGEKLWE